MLFSKRDKSKTGYEYVVKNVPSTIVFKHKKDSKAVSEIIKKSLTAPELVVMKVEYSDGYVVSEEVI